MLQPTPRAGISSVLAAALPEDTQEPITPLRYSTGTKAGRGRNTGVTADGGYISLGSLPPWAMLPQKLTPGVWDSSWSRPFGHSPAPSHSSQSCSCRTCERKRGSIPITSLWQCQLFNCPITCMHSLQNSNPVPPWALWQDECDWQPAGDKGPKRSASSHTLVQWQEGHSPIPLL